MFLPLDGAVHSLLQGIYVGNVDVVDVDAFLGEQGRQFAEQLAMPGLIWTSGGPGADSGLRRRMFATPAIFSVAQP
jgi:hypothetical protein